MGQRHQIFLKVRNPIKLKNLNLSSYEKKYAIKIFGNKNYTILAFHNQWLYGRSAAVNLLNILNCSNPDTMDTHTNPFSENYSSISSNCIEKYIRDIQYMINVQLNPLHPRGIGIESSFFLNDRDPKMRLYFDRGDNNDGITIIDTITRKYCMMNILNFGSDDETHGISALPYLKPISAREYMKAYYGESIETINPYYLKGMSDDNKLKLLESNTLGNLQISNQIIVNSKGVLTEKELQKIFPEFYKETVV